MFLPSATGFLWPGFCYSHSTLVGDVLKHSKRRQTASELLPVRWWWLGGNCIACLSTELCSWLQPCWLVGHKSFVACCICCTSGCYSAMSGVFLATDMISLWLFFHCNWLKSLSGVPFTTPMLTTGFMPVSVFLSISEAQACLVTDLLRFSHMTSVI